MDGLAWRVGIRRGPRSGRACPVRNCLLGRFPPLSSSQPGQPCSRAERRTGGAPGPAAAPLQPPGRSPSRACTTSIHSQSSPDTPNWEKEKATQGKVLVQPQPTLSVQHFWNGVMNHEWAKVFAVQPLLINILQTPCLSCLSLPGKSIRLDDGRNDEKWLLCEDDLARQDRVCGHQPQPCPLYLLQSPLNTTSSHSSCNI